VDGFLALAEYARTGSSCLFIMNYPAFLNPSIPENYPETKNADGLGFTYGYHLVMPNRDSSNGFYTWILRRYRRTFYDREFMKQSYTDIAFQICKRIWNEAQSSFAKGELYFYVGGINSVNPFDASIVKREAESWYKYVEPESIKINCTEGTVARWISKETR